MIYAVCGVFDFRGSRRISMQAWLLGSLLRGNKGRQIWVIGTIRERIEGNERDGGRILHAGTGENEEENEEENEIEETGTEETGREQTGTDGAEEGMPE